MITDRVRHLRKNYGNEIESKGVSFSAEVLLIKLVGAANLQSPVLARIIALVLQEHQIRMCFDERDKALPGPGCSKHG